MKQFFIPYELAVLAKEKGFDLGCLAMYDDKEKAPYMRGSMGNLWHNNDKGLLAASLYQQVLDWLRDKHKLHIEVVRNYDGWRYSIVEFSTGNKYVTNSSNETENYYTELNTAIEKALTLI